MLEVTGVGWHANFWKGIPTTEAQEEKANMARFLRLSTSEMDIAKDQAETALKNLPRDAVKTMADWWNQWYHSVGHRRLGRLLLSHKSIPTPKIPKREIAGYLENETLPEPKVRVVDEGLIYTLNTKHLDSSAFFEVRETGAEVCVVLNSNHPAFQAIELALAVPGSNGSETEELLPVDGGAMTLLLKAWSDVERRLPEGERKRQVQEMREDWGRVARDFLVGDSK